MIRVQTERFFFISADGFCQFVDIEYKDFLAAAHDLLSCSYVEMASFANGAFILTLDEVAKLARKPRNSFATLLYSNPHDFIAGNALMGSYGLRDGESDIVGISPGVESFLRELAKQKGIPIHPDRRYTTEERATV